MVGSMSFLISLRVLRVDTGRKKGMLELCKEEYACVVEYQAFFNLETKDPGREPKGNRKIMNREGKTEDLTEMETAMATVALSANAGISITFGGKRIWVDALHKAPAGTPDGYSHVTPEMWQQMQSDDAFADPDIICFTHLHPDHYSEEMMLQAATTYSKAGLILPEGISTLNGKPKTQNGRPNTLLLTGRQVVLRSDDLTMRFVRLPHEGAHYRDVVMYGLILSAGGKSILIGSDCETASERLIDFLQSGLKSQSDLKQSPELQAGVRIDLAILPFPWITLRKGRAFLEERLQPKHLFLYHLPFEEDDINGYREATQRALRDYAPAQTSDQAQAIDRSQAPYLSDIRLLDTPMQKESVML